MKEKINPGVAIGVIVAIVVLAAGAIYWKVSANPSDNGEKPPSIPADAAARLQTIVGTASGRPGGGGGMTAPPSGGTKAMPAMPGGGGGMTAPPGGGGGMTAPPSGGGQ